MEKLSRMEWSQKEMISDLNRLGNIIENSFLEKDGRVDDVQRLLSIRSFNETSIHSKMGISLFPLNA